MGWTAAKPIIFRRNDVIDETQAALSQIGREEKAAAADEVSPIARHSAYDKTRAALSGPRKYMSRLAGHLPQPA